MTGKTRLVVVLVLFVLGVGLSLALQQWTAPSAIASGVPQRIVVASPGLVECVFAIGAGDRVVGVSQFTDFPPEAKERPSIGGAFNPTFDRILELKPDLVLVQSKAEKLAAFCREKGIRIVHVNLETLADMLGGLLVLGELLDCEAQALVVVRRLTRGLQGAPEAGTSRPVPRVFLCTSHTPGSLRSLGSTGRGTFLTELVELAGGKSVFGDVAAPYPIVSKEALVSRAPEVIIELRPGACSDEERAQLLADWKLLPSLPAVRDGRIHILTASSLLIPGPRVLDTIRRLATAIHGEGRSLQ